jgi:hypothetical protein
MIVFILVGSCDIPLFIFMFSTEIHSSPQYGAVQLINFRNQKYMFRQVKEAVVSAVC